VIGPAVVVALVSPTGGNSASVIGEPASMLATTSV